MVKHGQSSGEGKLSGEGEVDRLRTHEGDMTGQVSGMEGRAMLQTDVFTIIQYYALYLSNILGKNQLSGMEYSFRCV